MGATARRPGAAQCLSFLSLRLSAVPESVPRARHALRAALGYDGEADAADLVDADVDVVDTLELLLSELVTNAVEHAQQGGFVQVDAERHDGVVRLLVADGGRGVPRRARARPGAPGEHGRGLLLVEALAEGWGSGRVAGGKVVWCDVRCDVPGGLGVDSGG